jgi:DUF971 family protein
MALADSGLPCTASTGDGTGTAAAPAALTLQLRSRRLSIAWQDGTSSSLPFDLLRQRCPCAQCRQAARAGQPCGVTGIDLIEVVPFGANAVQLLFSDGHARGIFPFAYLHALGGATAIYK